MKCDNKNDKKSFSYYLNKYRDEVFLLLVISLFIFIFIFNPNNLYKTRTNENSREYWEIQEKTEILNFNDKEKIGEINKSQKIYGDLIKYQGEKYILSDISGYSVLIKFNENNIIRLNNPKKDSTITDKQEETPNIFVFNEESTLNTKNDVLANINVLYFGISINNEDKNNYYYNCLGNICSIDKTKVTVISETGTSETGTSE